MLSHECGLLGESRLDHEEWAAWRVAHVGARLTARLGNALGSRWAWSNMAWALALDGTAHGPW